jgi:hypothetical protein
MWNTTTSHAWSRQLNTDKHTEKRICSVLLVPHKQKNIKHLLVALHCRSNMGYTAQYLDQKCICMAWRATSSLCESFSCTLWSWPRLTFTKHEMDLLFLSVCALCARKSVILYSYHFLLDHSEKRSHILWNQICTVHWARTLRTPTERIIFIQNTKHTNHNTNIIIWFMVNVSFQISVKSNV